MLKQGEVVLFAVFLVFGVLVSGNVIAYENYVADETDLENGYTRDLAPGDKIIFHIDGKEYYVQVLGVFRPASAEISVSANERQTLALDEEYRPDEMKFEITEDNYYDVFVKLNSIRYETDRDKDASITVKTINDEVPEGTVLPYSCLEWYECWDGTRVKQCETVTQYDEQGNPTGGGCGCRSISVLCPPRETETCEKYYTCGDGTKVKECEVVTQYDSEGNVVGGGCRCKDVASLCVEVGGSEDVCPSLTDLGPDFCKGGEIIALDDDENGCPRQPKCNKRLSNGRNAEVKIMPKTASEVAIERLKLNYCNEQNYCSIELKEVGKGDMIKAAYEVRVQKEGKLLGLFRVTAVVRVQVDSENGEVLDVEKPSWSFLASGI